MRGRFAAQRRASLLTTASPLTTKAPFTTTSLLTRKGIAAYGQLAGL